MYAIAKVAPKVTKYCDGRELMLAAADEFDKQPAVIFSNLFEEQFEDTHEA